MKKIILTVLLFIISFISPLSLVPLKTYKNAKAPKSVEASPCGTYIAVMNLEGMDFWLISTKTLKMKRIIKFFPTPAKGWNYKRRKPNSQPLRQAY